MLELKNMSGVITNSSSEVYVFDNMDSEFSKFIKDYSGELNFLKLSTKEDIERIMTSQVAQEKLLEYCDLPVGWLGMSTSILSFCPIIPCAPSKSRPTLRICGAFVPLDVPIFSNIDLKHF